SRTRLRAEAHQHPRSRTENQSLHAHDFHGRLARSVGLRNVNGRRHIWVAVPLLLVGCHKIHALTAPPVTGARSILIAQFNGTHGSLFGIDVPENGVPPYPLLTEPKDTTYYVLAF